MKESTLEYIRQLTLKDKKNLSQKHLKLSEEVGEMAAAILPYENADGVVHRFVTKEQILEEVADVFLTNVSIAMSLGYSDGEIEEVIERKIDKWAEIQYRESQMKWPVPYEIHITVKDVDRESFIHVCKELEVKPIILALQTTSYHIDDVMTSSKHYGNNVSAVSEMKRIVSGLVKHGFNVVREKIETVPWHPSAPSDEDSNPVMPEDCYFETHVGVIMEPGRENELRDIFEGGAIHFSKNAFKFLKDGSYVQMLTYRTYEGTREPFLEEAKTIRELLKEFDFKIDNVVTEFSIYDSKVSHDAKWLNNK